MNSRTLLIFSLLFVSFLLWQAWMDDQRPQPIAEQAAAVDTSNVDALPAQASDDLPGMVATPGATRIDDVPSSDSSLSNQQLIEVETDVLRLKLDLQGGSIVFAELLTFPQSSEHKDQPYLLMTEDADKVFISQAGLLSSDGEAPNHKARFSSAQSVYRLGDQDSMDVVLNWQNDEGIQVKRTLTFQKGKFDIGFKQEIVNQSPVTRHFSAYQQFQRTAAAERNALVINDPGQYSFTGAAIYNADDHFQKLDFDDFDNDPYQNQFNQGWAAIIQHYFFAAWIPLADESWHYSTRLLPASPNRYLISEVSPARAVPAGSQTTFASTLFIGPKLQEELPAVAKGLELVVNYGNFSVISKPLFWLMNFIHNVTDNWGWAIVLLTVLVKLAFFKLSESQFKSMARMRKLQPKVQALRERYAEDKQRLNEGMMKLYRDEKVNPLGGCLPMLVQIPVFIALYWVLLESVELRQASFMLWLTDLSTPDPYFVLPVLNGIFMVLTQKLSPQAGIDPLQQKIMMSMPIIFAVMFAFFQSGLVLYWTVNSGLSLLQQWVITRRIDAQES